MPDEPSQYRYDAFISYRHVAPDRGWAKWLHQAIETYRVPRQVAEQPGVRPLLRRVFRDEEELPVSSNLSREIDQALEQSRFLIVICSPKTPESHWCCAEIDRFREMGRHNQILALLVEGEPNESFPLPLRQIRRTRTLDDGTIEQTIDDVEPLAADVRPSRAESARVLKRAARLRFVACILGCRYDDLRQREQARQNRRKTIAVGAMALLAMVMTMLAVFAAIQADRARAAERLATRQRDVALDTLNALVVEAYDKLADRPGGRQLQDALLELAMDKLRAVNLDLEGGEGADRSAAVAMRRRGNLFLLAGRTEAAADLLNRSLATLEALHANSADDPRVQRDLASTAHLLGRLARRQGETRRAAEHFRRAMEIRHMLSQSQPDNLDLRAELGESYEYVGDAEQALGDTQAAAAHYRRSLEVRQALTEGRPDEPHVQRDLATAHSKLGDVSRTMGNLSAAREHYQQSMKLFEQLAQADRYNTRAQRDLAVAYNKLGSVNQSLGRLDDAVAAYGRSLQITANLAASDRGNLEWQRELALCYSNLGFISLRRNNGAAALDYYKRTLQINRDLADADPTNVQLQRNLADAYQLLGDARRHMGEPAEALRNYEASLAIRRDLAEADPHNTELQRDLSIALTLIGKLHAGAGRDVDARAFYEQALAIRAELAAANSANAQLQRDLAIAQTNLGMVSFGPQKVEHLRAALAIREQLAALDIGHRGPAAAVASTHHVLGLAQAERGDLAGAARSLRAAEAIFAEHAQTQPDDMTALGRLATTRKALVAVAHQRGELPEAIEVQQGLVETAGRLARIQQGNPRYLLQWAAAAATLGDLHRQAGDAERAQAAYAEARGIVERLDREGEAATVRAQRLADIARRAAELDEQQ